LSRPRDLTKRSHHVNNESQLARKIERLEKAIEPSTILSDLENSWLTYLEMERRAKQAEREYQERLSAWKILRKVRKPSSPEEWGMENSIHYADHVIQTPYRISDNETDEIDRFLNPPKPNTVKLEVQG
jgi:hypothetical protein